MAEGRRSRGMLWAVFGSAAFLLLLAALFAIAYYSFRPSSDYTYTVDGSGGKDRDCRSGRRHPQFQADG